MSFKAFTLIVLLGGALHLSAQQPIFIDTSYTAEQMVSDFFTNSCVVPSNVTFNGGAVSMGFFEGANTELGLNAGIVLSTGDVTTLSGTATDFSSFSFMSPGDSDLDDLLNGPYMTFDAAVLEFDIEVLEPGDLDFQYVFGSEEYPEYVGSAFNDVFAFWVNESGGMPANIAMVPGSSDFVAINTVNANSNSAYFIDYLGANGQDLVLDGFTTPLPATFTAMGNGMYHVKIALGDAGDSVFDSGVFIGIESLCGPMLLVPPTSFTVEQDGSTVTVTNESRYATSWHWDYGNGDFSNERYPEAYEYPEPGTYMITLTTQNYCCENTYTFEVTVEGTVSTQQVVEPFVQIHPNPVTDYLILEIERGGEAFFTISDVSGAELTGGIISGRTEVKLYDWPPGVYFLQFFRDGQTYTKRIVKQK